MKCNNQYCNWHYDGTCCHESEDEYDKATPNQLDCPSSLRSDFQVMLYNLTHECHSMIRNRNMDELIKIRRFMLNQRR